MRRKSLRVYLALKPDRFYLEWWPVSEGEMLTFFLPKEPLSFIFPLGVRKQELKIVADPDTLHNQSFFLFPCC